MKIIPTKIWKYLLLLLFSISTNTLIASNSETYNYHAIVISIDDYNSDMWAPLNNTEKDGAAISAILKSKYGFSNVTKIPNKSATRINIISTIERVILGLGENDNLVIFFSGYTTKIGMETYWVPVEAKKNGAHELLSTSEVKNILSRAKSKHILLMVDGLFNNTLMKSLKGTKVNDGSEAYYNEIDKPLSRQILISGSEKPTINGDETYSVFTKYLLKFLTTNEKKVFDAEELFQYIKNPVSANSPNSPSFGHIQNTGHEGGQFLFRLQSNSLDQHAGGEAKLCDSPVYFEEGEIVTFDEKGGTLHAKTDFKNVKYEWSYNSTLLDHDSPDLDIKKPGMYGVTIIMENGDCSNSAIAEVTIVMPTITIDILEGENIEFTKKGTLHATVSGYDGKILYEWRKGNFAVGETNTLEVSETDDYTLIVKLEDGRTLGQKKVYVKVNYLTYVVQLGDNIERIARKFYEDKDEGIEQIYKANPTLERGAVLRVGSELSIPTKNESYTTNTFVIGTTDAFAPFAYTDGPQGGMLTDVVQTVYQRIEQPIEIKYLPKNRLKGVYNGATDLSFPLTKNKKDNMLFLYSEPIYTTLVVFFANASSEIVDMEETMQSRMKKTQYPTKLNVGVPINFMCDNLLNYFDNGYIVIKPYATIEDCFKAMSNDEIDLVATPQLVGLVTLQNASTLNRNDFKILEKSIESTTLHVVTSKENPKANEIINDFNAALKQAKEDGTIGKIIDKHIDIIQKNRP